MEILKCCLLCGSDELSEPDSGSDLNQCAKCGYVFHNPRPTPQEIAEYYSRPSKYDKWLVAGSERDQLWRRRLTKLLRQNAGGELLDIGTGIGQFLMVAAPHFSSLTGTEVSASAAQIASDQYGLEVINDTLEQIEFGDRRFDVITIFHVLEHVHDPMAMVRKCHDLMRDEGLLLIAVPNELQAFRQKVRGFLNLLGILKSRFHGKLGIAPIVLDGSLDEIHLSHFTPAVLAGMVKKQGFTVIENGLDPYFVAHGVARYFQMAYFEFMNCVWKLTGHNCYDTIWLIAKKTIGSAKKGD